MFTDSVTVHETLLIRECLSALPIGHASPELSPGAGDASEGDPRLADASQSERGAPRMPADLIGKSTVSVEWLRSLSDDVEHAREELGKALLDGVGFLVAATFSRGTAEIVVRAALVAVVVATRKSGMSNRGRGSALRRVLELVVEEPLTPEEWGCFAQKYFASPEYDRCKAAFFNAVGRWSHELLEACGAVADPGGAARLEGTGALGPPTAWSSHDGPPARPDIRSLAGELLARPDDWLKASNPRLGGRRPIDLIDTAEEDRVYKLLAAFDQGLF